MISECVYCREVSLVSTHFQTYVCDDCYDRSFEERIAIVEKRKEREQEENE
tara:strand:+ start:519 stop:671 length:153 start_codon:yes stop_codon:yes gene_type:complete